MGRLYKRNRIWWCWGYDANRARWIESTRQHDRRAAELVAREIERRRTAVDGAPVEPLTLEQAIRDVMAARQREGKAPRTLVNYRRNGGTLCRILGRNTEVHSLTLASLGGFIDRRVAEGNTRATARVELMTLKAALSFAALHKRYRGDARAIWPREALRNANVPRTRWLTRDEYAKLIAAIYRPARRDYVTAYVLTGCRRTELFRIEARDVNLESGMLHIPGTKTRGADRWIPIAAELRPILEARMRTTRGPLFPTWHETKPLAYACTKAKIAPVSCNDLRRTFCSWLAQAGVPLLVTVRLMGHQDAKMVQSVYAQFAHDDLRAAIGRL